MVNKEDMDLEAGVRGDLGSAPHSIYQDREEEIPASR